MLDVSRRFRAQLGKSPRWATEVTWSNDGQHWETSRFLSGSVTRSLTDQVHWKASLDLDDTVRGLDGLNPFSTRLRIRHGIAYSPGDVELYPFGFYRVTKVSRSLRTGALQVEGSSIEDFIIRGTLVRPTTYKAASADTMVRKVIEPVLPDVSIYWDPRVAAGTPIPATLVESDRWGLIDGSSSSSSVAAAVQARVIADADGGLIVIPVPKVTDAPTWTLDAGQLLIDSTKDLTNDSVANIVVATGASTSGTQVGPGIAQDVDPNSPTRVTLPVAQGGFGPVPYFYTSSLLTTEAQCDATAIAKLSERVGLAQSVSIDSLHDPTKEPGDRGLVRTPDGLDLTMLDSLTYDLTGAPLQATTRTLSTRLDGEIWDLSTNDSGEGEDG